MLGACSRAGFGLLNSVLCHLKDGLGVQFGGLARAICSEEHNSLEAIFVTSSSHRCLVVLLFLPVGSRANNFAHSWP